MNIISTCKLSSVFAATIFLCACAGQAPINLGLQNDQLAPCPSSPNCISSYATDDHAIDPISTTSGIEDTKQQLLVILTGNPSATVISSQGNYIRAEFTSSLFGFVDDVEFLIFDHSVHMRSASRLGYSDLGANRTRLETIREAFSGSK